MTKGGTWCKPTANRPAPPRSFAASIDLRKAGGRACHGMGMLAETLVRGEQQRALDLVCQIQSEQPYDGMFDPNAKPKQTRKTAPPIDALRRLASHASNEQCLCIEKISRGL
jgi:hypothetical protein